MTEELDITNKEQLFKLTNLNDWCDNPFFDNAQTIAIYLYGEQGMEMQKLKRAFMAGTIIATKKLQSQLTKKDKQIEVTAKSKDLVINNQLEEINMLKEKIKQLEDKVANLEYLLEGRDNEIEELEKENAELREELNYAKTHCLFHSDCPTQKENAELKELISAKDIQIEELQKQKVYWKESSFDKRHKFFEKGSTKRLVQKDKQLTEAKELLKWWVSHCGNHDLHYAKKTEQFLNGK